MISIDKLVQQVQQCKDTNIILPNTNDSIYTQKTVFDIRKNELELLNNNFIQLNEANYTMDFELEKLNNNLQSSDNTIDNVSTNNKSNTIKDSNIDNIPSKSLIIYVENEIANIPEILTKILPNNLFKPQDWYIYGVKNPESFYKSFLLLTKLDFIIKNKTEKKNEVATFKREMAMQYETLYKSLNYRKLKFSRNDMVSNLTNVDNYTEYDALQYIADYSKINYIILDIITEKYIDIKYNNSLDIYLDSASGNENSVEFCIIIKYASNTYLPLMNSNGKHGFNKSILEIISKHFERIVVNKYKEPHYLDNDNENDNENNDEVQEGEIDNLSKLTYNIEDVYNMSIENLIGGYSIQNTLTNQESLINGPPTSFNNINDFVDIEEQEEEPMGLIINSNNSKIDVKVNSYGFNKGYDKGIDNPKKCNDIESLLSRIPMSSDIKPKKTKKDIALEAKLEKEKSKNVGSDSTVQNANTSNNDKEELKPLAKYNLVDLQILAKLYKIDTQKMGNCDKKINKLKGELYEEIKAKM
jgi:hypothetical protein